MQLYHYLWLCAHPDRADTWLRDRLADGFDIHHIDGDHANAAPRNLALIEHSDHFMLHGGRALRRVNRRGPRGPNKRTRGQGRMGSRMRRKTILEEHALRMALLDEYARAYV